MREVRSGNSYLGQNPLIQHFGLGDERGPVRVEVRWPSGRAQVVADVALNRTILIEEPEVEQSP